MAESYIFDGQIIDAVVYEETELVEVADLGTVGQSSVVIDDTTGTINIVGLKNFRHTESDCEDIHTLRGIVGDRTFERGVAEASNARVIKVSINDANEFLALRALRGADAKRPRESVHKRMQWLASTPELGNLVELGRYQRSDEMMDKADHRNTFPGDVLAECALAAGGYNYYVYQGSDGEPKLAFRDENASGSNSSVLRISNVSVSIGSNTFAPLDDATLRRTPESVFSRAILPYRNGTVMEERGATASNFRRRDGVAPNSNVKSAERASRQAREFLRQHKTEEDEIECTIEVPGGAVNLVHAGDRIQCQFGHFGPEGYSGWTYMRVKERRVRPKARSSAPAVYEMSLRLSPQEAGNVASSCPYELTPAGTYYPLGRVGDGWGNEVTPKPSDGVVYYLRPGVFYPSTPTPGYQGGWTWHFPELGVGGATTTDYAGDCVQNELRFILVGAGHVALQTKAHPTGTRPMSGSWGQEPNSYANSLGQWNSGALVEFDITGDCVNIVHIGDGSGSPCGGKWGWSSMVWTPA